MSNRYTNPLFIRSFKLFSCSGDDPLTGKGISTPSNPTQYNAIQTVQCIASGGYFTLTYRFHTTQLISWDADVGTIKRALEALPSIGLNGVTVSMIVTSQACLPVSSTWTVEFLQDFGNLPNMLPDFSKLILTGTGDLPTLTVQTTVTGAFY
jgi:hypothetical protein